MQKHDKYPLQLSGGEQQRVAIARAIAKDPLILIADVPTGNLDHNITQEIMGILRDIHARGTTVLVATHDREMVKRLGRRTLHIEDGRMA
jgi:cell division transport system ATP-binding protein